MFSRYGEYVASTKSPKKNDYIELFDNLSLATSHEDLLLIEQRKSKETSESFKSRVEAAYRALSFWFHPDKYKNLNLSQDLVEKIKTASEAISFAKERLSNLDNIREDQFATKNYEMYYLASPTKLKRIYPIFNQVIEIEIFDENRNPSDQVLAIFSKDEVRVLFENRKKILQKADQIKQQETLNERLSDQKLVFQNIADKYNLELLVLITERLNALERNIESFEGMNDSNISNEIESLQKEINSHLGKGVQLLSAVRNPEYAKIQHNNEFVQELERMSDVFIEGVNVQNARLKKMKDVFVAKVGEYQLSHPVTQEASGSSLRQRRVSSATAPITNDILDETDVEAKSHYQKSEVSFFAKHRNKFIVAGVALALMLLVVAAGVAFAPTLLALPFFMKASFGIMMTTGLVVSSKVILGTMVAGAALVVGGVGAAVTRGVIALVDFFKKSPAPAPDAGFAPVPDVSPRSPIIVEKNKDVAPAPAPGVKVEFAAQRSPREQHGLLSQVPGSANQANTVSAEPEKSFSFDVD